ncbi:hypothetical protein L1887_18879 [Cichorium endivia]|nr:hypothetical protein L1887_18879 [Cichorium endivia]
MAISVLNVKNLLCLNLVMFQVDHTKVITTKKPYSRRANFTKMICSCNVAITSSPSSLAPAGLSTISPSLALNWRDVQGPRVGNVPFKERCEELGVKVLRIVNANDPITKLPGVIFNETFSAWTCACYAHVGIELVLDYLKTDEEETHEISDHYMIDKMVKKGVKLMDFFKIEDILCVHDMQTYIEMIKNCPRRSRIRQKRIDFIKSLKENNIKFSVPLRYVAITCVVYHGCVTFANMMRLAYP